MHISITISGIFIVTSYDVCEKTAFGHVRTVKPESVYQIGYFPRHGSLRGVGSSRWKNIVAPGQRRRPETSVFRDWIALFEYSRIEKCSISAGKKWLDTFNSCFLLFRFKHVISPVCEGSFKKHPA